MADKIKIRNATKKKMELEVDNDTFGEFLVIGGSKTSDKAAKKSNNNRQQVVQPAKKAKTTKETAKKGDPQKSGPSEPQQAAKKTKKGDPQKSGPSEPQQAAKKSKPSEDDVAERIRMRDEFLREVRKANRMASTEKLSVRPAIESVLRQNNCPQFVTRGKNLYHYFGTGKINPPSKEIYYAMKRALEFKDLRTTIAKVAIIEAEAEREKVRLEVKELMETVRKEKVQKEMVQKENAREDAVWQQAAGTSKGSISQFLVAKPKPRNIFNHSLKCHLIALFHEGIEKYGSDEDTKLSIASYELCNNCACSHNSK